MVGREHKNASGHLSLGLSLLAESGVLGGASLEAVLESSGNVLEVAGAASADGPSPLGLLAPVVLSHLSSRVSARGALMLLDVQRTAAASSAESVRLVVTLTKAGGTLRHLGGRLCLGVKLDDDFTNCLIWGESNAFFAVECRIASPNFCVGVAWARHPSKPRDDTLSALHVIPLFAYLKWSLSHLLVLLVPSPISTRPKGAPA